MEGKMTKTGAMVVSLWCATLVMPLFAFNGRAASDGGAAGATSHKSAGVSYSSDGDRVFKQNCSRCHNAPQSFPPQISGTVIRHMRVRASLSREDEQTLLKFLNP
jgi:cytochrome c5